MSLNLVLYRLDLSWIQDTGYRTHDTDIKDTGYRTHDTDIKDSGYRTHDTDIKDTGYRTHDTDIKDTGYKVIIENNWKYIFPLIEILDQQCINSNCKLSSSLLQHGKFSLSL